MRRSFHGRRRTLVRQGSLQRIPNGGSGTSAVSGRAHIYPSDTGAQQAGAMMRSSDDACDWTARTSPAEAGDVTPTVAIGHVPGMTARADSRGIHGDVEAGASVRNRVAGVRLNVFSDSRNAILATSIASATTATAGYAKEQRSAFRTIARKLSDGWDVQ